MFKNIKKGMFPFLVGFSALSVSGSAAFYSVFGLSKLFAGASTEVIIMAGSLEIAKLVTASLLYQYWDKINKLLNDKKLSTEKVKEEIKELFQAVEKNTNKIHESADVLYHLLVYLETNGIKIEDVMDELKKRKK